jgi:prepilin-type N-terminal cleavage/methylation domain-containing protein
MKNGFTLIELMIVIAIIAIIAAIAIPNLLESRVSAQEAAAATALKSGILPAEVQFQAGAYQDADGNGLGEYAVSNGLGAGKSFPLLSGATTTTGGVTLNLLAPTYQAANPSISGYKFNDPASENSSQERVWGVINQPLDQNQGRRIFAINQAGNIYASKPNVSAFASTTGVQDGTLFGVSLVSAPSNVDWVPYRR